MLASRAEGVAEGARVDGYLRRRRTCWSRPHGRPVLPWSKTACGTGFLLREQGVHVVALTSPRNVASTRRLGCYDDVLPYDRVPHPPVEPTVSAGLAGSVTLRAALHHHLTWALVHDAVGGVTHQDSGPAGPLAGARRQVFFAPEQVRKRSGGWGRDGRFSAAWRRFAPVVDGWVDVMVADGPQGWSGCGGRWRPAAPGRGPATSSGSEAALRPL